MRGVPESTTQALRRLDRSLGEVGLPAPGAPLAPWTPTRLNVRMHRLLHLADVVLAHASVEHERGDTQTHGFVVKMAWLFETLVARLLGEQTRGLAPQQTMPLDTLSRLTIKPDLVFYEPGGVVAVADTKYKLLDDDGKVPNADVYQLVTYCARLNLSEGHLIYVSDEAAPEPFDVVGTNVRLFVHAVDLARPLDDVETQVGHIGDRIASHQGRRPEAGRAGNLIATAGGLSAS